MEENNESENELSLSLSESLDSHYLLRVEQQADVEKTFISTRPISQPLDDDEEEFTLDSLDFNFTTCGENNYGNYGRRSIIGQINNNNLSTIAVEYASLLEHSDKLDEEEEESKEEEKPSSERISDTFDPLQLIITKKHFNCKDLTPKEGAKAMEQLHSRLETSKTMYPTKIKDNVKKNLDKIVTDLKSKVHDIDEKRKKPVVPEKDDEHELLSNIINQLEYKLTSLNNRLKIASDLMKTCATK